MQIFNQQQNVIKNFLSRFYFSSFFMTMLAFFSLSSVHADTAKNCTYSINQNKTKITWTAFKTPKKIGVQGEFKNFSIKSQEAKTIPDVIRNSQFSIDTSSVNTGNSLRDKKIVRYFFTRKNQPLRISGKVLTLNDENKTTSVLLKMNDVEKSVVMRNKIEGDHVSLKGNIDVLDFLLANELKAINKACYDLHEGKTWSDVLIEIQAVMTKKCLSSKI